MRRARRPGPPLGHAAARRRDGADGGGRRDRRRQRPHRGARRRAVAVRAPGGRRARPRRRLRPRLPYPVQYRADALLNPAVFHDAMPASTIKPIMAAAFLVRPRGRRALARRRARGDAARRDAVARQPARPADAIRLGALSRSHVLPRQGLRRLPAARGTCRRRRRRSAGTPAARDARARLRQARPAVRPRARRAPASALRCAPGATAGRLRPR